MSYAAYYIGGPWDLHKEIRREPHPLHMIRIADIPAMPYVDLAPKSMALTVTYHEYDLIAEPYDRLGAYHIAVYVWRRA